MKNSNIIKAEISGDCMTAREVCRKLRIKTPALKNMIQNGLVECIMLPGDGRDKRRETLSTVRFTAGQYAKLIEELTIR